MSKNKFIRYPNLSQKKLLQDLALYQEAIKKRKNFITEFRDVYSMPKRLAQKNLSILEKELKAISVLQKSLEK